MPGSSPGMTSHRTGIADPRRAARNGKPPGGDPAAPVRRRSCRGAGSATAGARLMWGLQALFARVLQISRAVHATRAPIAHSAALASAELAFGASAEPAVCASQAVAHREWSLLARVK